MNTEATQLAQSSGRLNRDAVIETTPNGRVWMGIVILLALYCLSFVDKQIIALMVRPMRATLNLSNVEIAVVHGVAYSLFYAAAGIPLGWLVDRFSPRWIICIGVLVWSVATMLCAFSPGFAWLFSCRLGVGIGEAALVPAAFVIIATSFPRGHMAMASALFMVGSLAGNGAAFAVGGQVVSTLNTAAGFNFPYIGHFEPWRAAFIIVGCPGLVLAWFALFLPDRTMKRDPYAQGSTAATGETFYFRSFLRTNSRFLLCHLGGFALLGAAAYAGQAWGPTYLTQAYGWRSSQVGNAFGLIIGVFGTIGTFSSAKLVDGWFRGGTRDAHVRFHIITTLIGAPFAVAAFLVPNSGLCVAFLCVAYVSLFSFAGTATSALQLVAPPGLRGRVAALYGIALVLGGAAAGPLIVATIQDVFFAKNDQMGAAIAISTAVCACASLVLMLFALKPLRESQARLEATLESEKVIVEHA